ncbi:3-deoxy-D-manno-octulosonic acid kinase [Vibrio sp. WJH972]
MKKSEQGRQTIWFDDELLDVSEIDRCCDVDYWHQVNAVVGSAQGRGTTWFIQLALMQAALRHYRRGGLFGKLVKDHYIYSSLEKTRSYQEFSLLQQLHLGGVAVPRPIAARVIKKHFCYQADLLSERIPNASDLVSVLRERKLSDDIYEKIGIEIAKMHQIGVNHTDLNIHNILLDDSNKVWIIDFDKCCQVSKNNSEEWKQNNIARLLRSFEKESVRECIHWDKTRDWSALISGYKTLK